MKDMEELQNDPERLMRRNEGWEAEEKQQESDRWKKLLLNHVGTVEDITIASHQPFYHRTSNLGQVRPGMGSRMDRQP